MELVVVDPAYIGGNPVSVLLEAEHEADSVIVKGAVTVTVSADAVVISVPMVSKFHNHSKEILKAHPLRNCCLWSFL